MPDFHIADHGSIITIAPVSEAAQDWTDKNVISRALAVAGWRSASITAVLAI
jgi:hypothetical protein